MFAVFFEKRRVSAHLGRTLPTLPTRIAAMTPIERSAALATANAVLLAVHDDSGVPVATRPHTIPAATAVSLVSALTLQRRVTVDAVKDAGETVSPISLAQATREILAYDLVACTIGTALGQTDGRLVSTSWRDLVSGSAPKAVELLAAFARETGTYPLPIRRDRKWTTEQVVRLASSPPPFVPPLPVAEVGAA